MTGSPVISFWQTSDSDLGSSSSSTTTNMAVSIVDTDLAFAGSEDNFGECSYPVAAEIVVPTAISIPVAA